jgi:transcription termination factor NusB
MNVKEDMLKKKKEINEKTHITIVFITHEMDVAKKLFDRIAFMDVIIMQTALAEILSFPNIPVSVSLNEYVEIAKLYSTSKSGSFINGTLDGIVNQLKKEGKLTKN